MSNVSELCDDVVMINDGRIVLNGPIQQVRDSYGLTRIIVRCALSTEELRAVPHVLSADKRKDGGVELRIEDENTDLKYLILFQRDHMSERLTMSHRRLMRFLKKRPVKK